MTLRDLTYSPLIIYCHGNGGNKIDIVEIFDYLLWEFNILSFDFSGSGRSEGDHVTLGYFEKDDIKAVVDFLRKELNINKIILYGRSMGAVSALQYAAEDPNIKAIVLDSPFANFPNLCKDILFSRFCIPNMLSHVVIELAREKIMSKLKEFDINEFIPVNSAKKVLVPTIMIHGLQDSLVHFNNSREIYNNLNKNIYKKLIEVEGEHNDCRSKKDHYIIRDFIIRFAYDISIINEYNRRMNTLNAQYAFAHKNGIRISKVIKNMKTRFSLKKGRLSNLNLKEEANNSFSTKDISSYDVVKKKVRSKSTNPNDDDEKIVKLRECYSKTFKVKRDHSVDPIPLQRTNAEISFDEDNNTSHIMELDQTIYCQALTDIITVDRKSDDSFIINECDVSTYSVNIENKNIHHNIKKISENIVHDSSQNNTTTQSKVSSQSENLNNTTQAQTINNTETKTENSKNVENSLQNEKNSVLNNIPKIRPKLRSERNNLVGSILNCEIRVTSDKIKFENLDRSNLKKKTSKG